MYIWRNNLNRTFLVVYLYNILVPTIFLWDICNPYYGYIYLSAVDKLYNFIKFGTKYVVIIIWDFYVTIIRVTNGYKIRTKYILIGLELFWLYIITTKYNKFSSSINYARNTKIG